MNGGSNLTSNSTNSKQLMLKPLPLSVEQNLSIPAKKENVFKTKSLISASKESKKSKKQRNLSSNSNISTNVPNFGNNTNNSYINNSRFDEGNYDLPLKGNKETIESSGNTGNSNKGNNGGLSNRQSPKNKRLQRNNSCDIELDTITNKYMDRFENRVRKKIDREKNDNSGFSRNSDKSFDKIMQTRDSNMNNSNIDFSFENSKYENFGDKDRIKQSKQTHIITLYHYNNTILILINY